MARALALLALLCLLPALSLAEIPCGSMCSTPQADGELCDQYSATGFLGVAEGGVGWYESQTGTFQLVLPPTATSVETAFLYWAGIVTGSNCAALDDVTLTVDGTVHTVAAEVVYGPASWFGTKRHCVYAACVTNLIPSTTSTIVVSQSGNWYAAYGSGVIAIYEDATSFTSPREVRIKQGLDGGFCGWQPSARGDNEPNCFS